MQRPGLIPSAVDNLLPTLACGQTLRAARSAHRSPRACLRPDALPTGFARGQVARTVARPPLRPAAGGPTSDLWMDLSRFAAQCGAPDCRPASPVTRDARFR